MEKDVLDKLLVLIEKKRVENTSLKKASELVDERPYKNNLTEEQIRDFSEQCWGLLESNVKERFTKDLLSADQESLVNRFATNISRSLKGVSSERSIENQLKNFRDVEIHTYSEKPTIYYEKEFADLLGEINPVKSEKNGNAFVGNTATQLGTLKPMRKGQDQKDLFKVTANLLAGIATTKSNSGVFRPRTADPTIITKDGQMPLVLVEAIATYADQNLSALGKLDKKTLKYIGGVLKESYKAMLADPSKAYHPMFSPVIKLDDLSRAFNLVNIAEQEKLHAQIQTDNTVIGRLSKIFKRRERSNSDSSTISTSSHSSAKSQDSGNERGV